jgi:hypothetical protein
MAKAPTRDRERCGAERATANGGHTCAAHRLTRCKISEFDELHRRVDFEDLKWTKKSRLNAIDLVTQPPDYSEAELRTRCALILRFFSLHEGARAQRVSSMLSHGATVVDDSGKRSTFGLCPTCLDNRNAQTAAWRSGVPSFDPRKREKNSFAPLSVPMAKLRLGLAERGEAKIET